MNDTDEMLRQQREDEDRSEAMERYRDELFDALERGMERELPRGVQRSGTG